MKSPRPPKKPASKMTPRKSPRPEENPRYLPDPGEVERKSLRNYAKGGMCRGMGAAKKGGKYGKSG